MKTQKGTTMKTISSWIDFKEYGIIYLTRESCSYNLRILFDLTTEGAKLLTDFLGQNVSIQNNSNWNSKAVASIMLPPSIFEDLAIFTLFEKTDCVRINKYWNNLIGFNQKEVNDGSAETITGYSRTFTKSTSGSRNLHCMSGRTA
jgi:hypothetical protein